MTSPPVSDPGCARVVSLLRCGRVTRLASAPADVTSASKTDAVPTEVVPVDAVPTEAVPVASQVGDAAALTEQVFVDASGRRRRWVRYCGLALVASCAGYIGIVVVALNETGVGPMTQLPDDNGNDQIPGLEQGSGVVPGLLAPQPQAAVAPLPGIRAGVGARPTRSATRGSEPVVATESQLAKLAPTGPHQHRRKGAKQKHHPRHGAGRPSASPHLP